MPDDVLRALRAAGVAEVAWRGPGAGSPVGATGALPLVDDGRPVLALPYADLVTARALGDAEQVLLTLTEPRGAGAGHVPLAVRARPRLVEDPEGDRFCERLLDQELLRWPPSRLLADSVLLRREHWWWLPRLLVELDIVDVSPLAVREDPADHVLVVADEQRDALVPALARVHDPRSVSPMVDLLHGAPGPGEAVLLGQDLSFPDLERWGRWTWQGRWDGAALTVRQAPGAVGLPPPRGVLARWRHHRDLERACRRGLRDARGSGGVAARGRPRL